MTKALPFRANVCQYCGLLSAATSHGSVGECVDALQHEVARLRDRLRQGKPSAPIVSQRAWDRDHAGAASARLSRLG
jgi:hypothetical protein